MIYKQNTFFKIEAAFTINKWAKLHYISTFDDINFIEKQVNI
jgi:hypothetical protein